MSKKLNGIRVPIPELSPELRRRSFDDVILGYTLDLAKLEADRCLLCKKPLCIQGCPVAIDIPGFIKKIAEGNLAESYAILRQSTPLPAVCGRVCPQETQCEVKCVVGRKGTPVAIGQLERFVGDWGLDHQETVDKAPSATLPSSAAPRRTSDSTPASGILGRLASGTFSAVSTKVAIIGSGPAGLACAQDLALAGLQVTIFEALHTAGGVLAYGIPPFRLPRRIVEREVEKLRGLGVRFEFNKVIGRLFTIEQLMTEQGFAAVFIGTGAGLPKFLGLPGEHLNGIMSANEFLTRVNLMHGFEGADTPVGLGRHVAIIGAGNTALDAARTALRMKTDEVSLVYRRTEAESPARIEELRHAKEEGVRFRWLTNPAGFTGNETGRVTQMTCISMELGEPDESGRRSPRPIPNSKFQLPVDTVIYALGTVTNPIISRSTPDLKINRWGYLETDPETGMTSIPGVFAGGDIVTGSATVVLALGAGRRAARGMLHYLGFSKEAGREEPLHGLAMP